ncbi:MAG: cysteine desulfurase [Clostridiales bacterium]|nr:cysteine desulfurase [Clostridiales bacterium]
MIYLDNAATTKPFDGVIRRMAHFYTEAYFNPSALYAPAFDTAKELEESRSYLLSALGGWGNLYFTSCATESNSWVFRCGIKNKRGNIVVSAGEHASVYENAQALISAGIDVRFVSLNADSTVNQDDFAQKVDADTTLVSVIHCSNETGAINDIKTLATLAKSKNGKLLFHADGVQAFGKMTVDCRDAGIDLYSISAHKIGGPKGVGALWVREGLHLSPFLIGGGQEKGLRSGTENVAGIAGFAEAFRLFSQIDKQKIAKLKNILKEALCALPYVSVNGSDTGSPFVLSVAVQGVKAEILQRKLAECGILVGLGSACASRLKKNRVLSAMGKNKEQIEGSVRLSFGAENVNTDGVAVGQQIADCIKSLHIQRR